MKEQDTANQSNEYQASTLQFLKSLLYIHCIGEFTASLHFNDYFV